MVSIAGERKYMYFYNEAVQVNVNSVTAVAVTTISLVFLTGVT